MAQKKKSVKTATAKSSASKARKPARPGAKSSRPASKPAIAKGAASRRAAPPRPVAAKAKAIKTHAVARAPAAAERPGAKANLKVMMAATARPASPPKAIASMIPKTAAARVTAPATAAVAPRAQAQPASPKHIAVKAVGGGIARAAHAPPATPVVSGVSMAKKPVSQRHGFKTNEYIVYPTHGVGRIVGIEEQEIAGMSLELFVIQFDKDKMTLRVPTGKSQSVGMRKLSEEPTVKRAMETLKGKARIKRTMWSRRAQEYETKINSGDLISIAEVVRDLYRSESQPEQSYSERQLYEAALDRMAREIAAVERLDERGAVQRITEVLAKSARTRREAAGEAGEIQAA